MTAHLESRHLFSPAAPGSTFPHRGASPSGFLIQTAFLVLLAAAARARIVPTYRLALNGETKQVRLLVPVIVVAAVEPVSIKIVLFEIVVVFPQSVRKKIAQMRIARNIRSRNELQQNSG